MKRPVLTERQNGSSTTSTTITPGATHSAAANHDRLKEEGRDMSSLAPELLDYIFSYVCEIERATEGVYLYHKAELFSFSLVCSAWHASARRRLQCLLSIKHVDDVARARKRFASGHLEPRNIKILEIMLYRRSLPKESKATSMHLQSLTGLLLHVKECHVDTQLVEDDACLADCMSGLLGLETLVIRHSWGSIPRGSVTTDSDNEDSRYYPNHTVQEAAVRMRARLDDQWRTDTLADGSSLLKYALPRLKSLRHLLLQRIHFPHPLIDLSSPPPFTLHQLSLNRVNSACPELLRWLLSKSGSLSQFSLLSSNLGENADLTALRPHGKTLKCLSIAVPYQQPLSNEDPNHARHSAPLKGISDAILPYCRHLHHLCIQDGSLNLAGIPVLTTVKQVVLGLRRLSDYKAMQLETSFPHLECLELRIREHWTPEEHANKDFTWSTQSRLRLRPGG